MSKSKLLTGVIIGASAGAVLGILLAPDKGTETRKKLAKKSSDVTNSVKESIGKISDNLTDKYQNIKEDAKEMIEKGKNKTNNIKEDYKAETSF